MHICPGTKFENLKHPNYHSVIRGLMMFTVNCSIMMTGILFG